MAAAAHFAQRNNGDSCLRLMVEALQQGHALGEFVPLESPAFSATQLAVRQHSACLVRASQWEVRSRWPVAGTTSKACAAKCSATT